MIWCNRNSDLGILNLTGDRAGDPKIKSILDFKQFSLVLN